MPFIGDGDIAFELYRDRRVYGADLDPQRVAVAAARFPDSDVRVFDCDRWPFAGVEEPFAVADLDAYSNPYKALVAFWTNARTTKRVVIFGTDGMKQGLVRLVSTATLPEGKYTKATLTEARQHANFWWPKHVRPFVEKTIAPARIARVGFYQRGMMVYWGAVIDRR